MSTMMTVGKLIEFLSSLPKDTPVMTGVEWALGTHGDHIYMLEEPEDKSEQGKTRLIVIA